MYEVLTIETNCFGWGLNAESEFKIRSRQCVVERPIRNWLSVCALLCLSSPGWLHWSAGHLREKTSSRQQGVNSEFVLLFFPFFHLQIHCQHRNKSWHRWGSLVMNQTQIFGYMQISKVTVVSLHHLFATLSTAKQQHTISLCCKPQREPIHFNPACLLSLWGAHFSA